MSDAVFLYRPLSDQAVLSGGSWVADGDIALTNVQNDRYWSIARSASTLAADAQIRVDMRRAVDVRGFALALPNITTAAEVTVTAFADAGYTAPTFTTGPITGGETGERWKDDERAPIISVAFAQAVSARYWLVEIDDPLNPSGSIEVARLFLAEGLSPSFNYTYGATLTFKNNTLASTTLAGGARHWRRVNPKQWQCSFQYLPDAEAFGSVYDFLRHVGFDREVFIIPEPGDTAHAQARRFFGTISQLDALSQAVIGRSNFGFSVEEKVAHAAAPPAFPVLPFVRLVHRDFAPTISTGGSVIVPVDEMVLQEFAPVLVSGVNVICPIDYLEWSDEAVKVSVGAIVRVPSDQLIVADYGPDVASGGGVVVPTDHLQITDGTPQIAAGAHIAVPPDQMIVTEYPPVTGAGVIIAVPTSTMVWADFEPTSVSGGASVLSPTDSMVISDHPIADLGGFNSGFSTGFR